MKVLFVTTKSISYLRNVQEINSLKKSSNEVFVIGSNSSIYIIRIIYVWLRLLFISFKPFDLFFAGFLPQLFLPLFYRKIRRAGCKVYEDFFISLYDTLCYDRCLVSPDNMIGRMLHEWDSLTLKLSDKIICDTQAQGDFFIEELGADPKKIEVVYLEADRSIFNPELYNKNELIKSVVPNSILSKDDCVVLYFGSVLPLQGVDIVLCAMLELVKKGYYCIFIGPLSTKQRSLITKKDEHFLFVPWVSTKRLAEMISIADLCLAGHFNANILKASRTIPGKAYIYEAMGKPMILGDNTANRERFKESQNNIYIEMGSTQALIEGVVKWKKDR